MRYSIIVRYVREGDKVTPVRYSRFDYAGRDKMPLGHHVKVLTMDYLFRGHTTWVNEQVIEANRRVPAQPVKMAA